MTYEHYSHSRHIPLGLMRLRAGRITIELSPWSWYGFGLRSDELALGPLWLDWSL